LMQPLLHDREGPLTTMSSAEGEEACMMQD
jgi:hypothetical protein